MSTTDRCPTESNLSDYFANIITEKGEKTDIAIDHDYYEWTYKEPIYKEVLAICILHSNPIYIKETKDILIPHTLVEVTDFLSNRTITVNTEYLLHAENILVVEYGFKDKRNNEHIVYKKIHYSKKGKLKLV